MRSASLPSILSYLRRRAGTPADGAPSDAELLHVRQPSGGGGVRGLGRTSCGDGTGRLPARLRNDHDAEDVLQATFLVLAQGRIGVERTLGRRLAVSRGGAAGRSGPIRGPAAALVKPVRSPP